MKISQYTFLIEQNDRYCLYNTVSNRLISVDKSFYKVLEKHKNSQTELSADFLEKYKDFAKELINGFFVTENDADALLWIKNILWSRRNNRYVYNITIAPTMDCNFSCFYCFEKNRKGTMSPKVMDGIVNYINQQTDMKFLNLVWFGGEPLLAYPKMKQIVERLEFSEDVSVSSLLITNGYYLTPEVVDNLEALRISRIQLSIDGIFEQYNEVKFMPKDKKCFDQVLNNLDYFSEKSNIPLVLRLNIGKRNKNQFFDVVDFFRNRYPNKSISVVPAFLKPTKNNASNCKSNCFASKKEIIDFNTFVYQKTKDLSFIYPPDNFLECAVRNHNTVVFAPDGTVYKCWEVIGEKEHAIGHIKKDGTVEISSPTVLTRHHFGADPMSNTTCQKCSIFPICVGGCPQRRIFKEFHGSKKNLCSNFKQSLIANLKQRIESL